MKFAKDPKMFVFKLNGIYGRYVEKISSEYVLTGKWWTKSCWTFTFVVNLWQEIKDEKRIIKIQENRFIMFKKQNSSKKHSSVKRWKYKQNQSNWNKFWSDIWDYVQIPSECLLNIFHKRILISVPQ